MTEPDAVVLRRLRERMIRIAHLRGGAHLPSSFSVLEILYVLYARVLGTTPANWEDPESNRFILSKGHAALALYCVLENFGFLPWGAVEQFGVSLAGHPDPMTPGVEHPTGSLGHGLAFAVGLAIGLKHQRSPARVYCLVGDQELNEGACWEAAMLAGMHRLDNLVCVVDDNGSGRGSLDPRPIWKKFDAFGWDTVIGLPSGERPVLESVLRSRSDRGAPLAVVAMTTKGAGSLTMMRDPQAWHHRAPTAREAEQLIAELDQ